MPVEGGARIRVEAGSSAPLRRIWRFIGYDEPNYTYGRLGTSLLGRIGLLDDAPYFIRTHFLLCNGDGRGRPKWGSTNVYRQGERGEAVYDWGIWDRILDGILAANCRPFVEIGFMPESLTTAPAGTRYDDIYEGGWRYPPKSLDRWGELVAAVAAHCRDRYGPREVASWYWELWNEPDIFYWAGSLEDYCRLFDYTERALHAALPYARLGGPATTGPSESRAREFLSGFLDRCLRGRNACSGETGTRLDFVTFHAKGALYAKDGAAGKQTPSIATLVDHVRTGLRVIGGYPELKGTEVVLSECDPDGWAAGSKRDNPNLGFRNTEYYAGYLASTVCSLLDLEDPSGLRVDGMLTWAFEFEDRALFEGLRTLATNDVDKPVLNALRMLARLGGARLPLAVSGARGDGPLVQGIATRRDGGALAILLVCHHDDWDVAGSVEASVEVRGLPDGRRYALRELALDRDHANSYAAWQALGEPPEPSEAGILALQAASALRFSTARELDAGRGALTIPLRLPVHGLRLLLVEEEG